MLFCSFTIYIIHTRGKWVGFQLEHTSCIGMFSLLFLTERHYNTWVLSLERYYEKNNQHAWSIKKTVNMYSTEWPALLSNLIFIYLFFIGHCIFLIPCVGRSVPNLYWFLFGYLFDNSYKDLMWYLSFTNYYPINILYTYIYGYNNLLISDIM